MPNLFLQVFLGALVATSALGSDANLPSPPVDASTAVLEKTGTTNSHLAALGALGAAAEFVEKGAPLVLKIRQDFFCDEYGQRTYPTQAQAVTLVELWLYLTAPYFGKNTALVEPIQATEGPVVDLWKDFQQKVVHFAALNGLGFQEGARLLKLGLDNDPAFRALIPQSPPSLL